MDTTIFQFHFGAIKRAQESESPDKRSIFQFHFGAIKRQIRLRQVRLLFRHFNSTLVRLKVRQFRNTLQVLSNFNSTLVRLKDPSKTPIIKTIAIFQFHFGAIKRLKGLVVKIFKQNFNSTLVRLKGKWQQKRATT